MTTSELDKEIRGMREDIQGLRVDVALCTSACKANVDDNASVRRAVFGNGMGWGLKAHVKGLMVAVGIMGGSFTVFGAWSAIQVMFVGG